MLEQIKPMDIEKRSFEIITRLLGDRELDPENELVIKRVIHTTADFDYAENLVFTPDAVKTGIRALEAGAVIVTDTNMARAGINKKKAESLGVEVFCFMADPDVPERLYQSGSQHGKIRFPFWKGRIGYAAGDLCHWKCSYGIVRAL